MRPPFLPRSTAPPLHDSAQRSTLHTPLLAHALYVGLVLALAQTLEKLAPAAWLLGFWHYALYWLAYGCTAVPLAIFKRDALVMKTVALVLFGAAYFSVTIDALSLVVVCLGFALNSAAAHVLGADRTYYGEEIAGLPPLRVNRFPYSWIAHPMLLGNVLAFGGTLINAEFRAGWWPLACAHVAMNLGLIWMETQVKPGRLARLNGYFQAGKTAGRATFSGAVWVLVGAAIGVLGPWQLATATAAWVGALSAAYGFVIFRSYLPPTIAPGNTAA